LLRLKQGFKIAIHGRKGKDNSRCGCVLTIARWMAVGAVMLKQFDPVCSAVLKSGLLCRHKMNK
jgi:hypothetical protein